MKMVEQKPDEVRVGRDAEIQAVEFDDAENRFAEQRRDADDARLGGQRAAEARQQVQRSQRHGPGHLDRMARARRHPDAAMNRDDPRAFGRAHRHDALRRVDELMPRMRMGPDNVAVGVLGHDVGPDLVLVGVKKPVALFRH